MKSSVWGIFALCMHTSHQDTPHWRPSQEETLSMHVVGWQPAGRLAAEPVVPNERRGVVDNDTSTRIEGTAHRRQRGLPPPLA